MKAEKVVKVKWIDSMSDNGRWTLAEDIDMKPTECTTYGFLVEANEEEFITVAQTLAMEPEQYCQMMCIPAKSITDYWVIEDLSKQDGGAVDPEEPGRN